MRAKKWMSVLLGGLMIAGTFTAVSCGGPRGKVGVLRIDAFEGGAEERMRRLWRTLIGNIIRK